MQELRAICARIPGNELAAVECRQLTGGQPDAQGVAVCQRVDLIPRAAFVSLGLRCIAEGGTLEELTRRIAEASPPADRFRIDVLRLSPQARLSERQAVVTAADALDGAPDLDDPAQRFLIVAQADRLWFGEVLTVAQADYRKHDARPFRTTSSLPARLARALVNLAAPAAQSIADPFCGTGTILLEASALGVPAFGSDVNPKMTGMTRRNLAYFGYPAFVKKQDALDCQQNADAIVTDLPYGRILKIDAGRLEKILERLVRLAPLAIYLAESDISGLLRDAGYREVEVLRVRKSHALSRFVHRARRDQD